ncbi:MAG: hypothetical protein ACI835_004134, partial [Planctomycetota bacterium]
ERFSQPESSLFALLLCNRQPGRITKVWTA